VALEWWVLRPRCPHEQRGGGPRRCPRARDRHESTNRNARCAGPNARRWVGAVSAPLPTENGGQARFNDPQKSW